MERSSTVHDLWLINVVGQQGDRTLAIAYAEGPKPMKLTAAVSKPEDAGPVETKDIYAVPVLDAFHSDFIMRCHATMWKAPGGIHCGGYCTCKVKHEVTVGDMVCTISWCTSDTFASESRA